MKNDLPVYVIVRSFYEDDQTIRYRMAITRETLVRSLVNQSIDVTLCWTFPVGCLHTQSRVEMLQKEDVAFLLHDPPADEKRVEIYCSDDVFLMPQLAESIRRLSLANFEFGYASTEFEIGDGYIFWEDGIRPVKSDRSFVSAKSFGLFGVSVCEMGISEPSFIAVRHQCSDRQMRRPSSDSVITKLPVENWNADLVDRYRRVRMTYASANGSTLEVSKAKSLIRKKRNGRR